jgi:hypothetical protein
VISFDSLAPFWAHQFLAELIPFLEDEFAQPRPLPKTTLAELPDATTHEGCRFYVSDGAGDKYEVISNGTAWFYQEGTPV